MEQYKCLGIYIAENRATAALVGRGAGDIEILDGFSLAPQRQSGQQVSVTQIIAAVAEKISQADYSFEYIAVSLDCRLYRQQIIHSEFSDYRQISQTIAFDAEETLAVDAANTAVAFEIAGKAATGSQVSVFAAPGSTLSDIITSLASAKLDPASVEPDAICLRRIIKRLFTSDEPENMWAAISDDKCYIVGTAGEDEKEYVRNFIIGKNQTKTNLLAREIIMTNAGNLTWPSPAKLRLFDTTGQIDFGSLSEQIGFAAVKEELPAAGKNFDADMLELITAAGAAVSQLVRCDRVDFRPAFMPYQGKKVIMEKTLKIIGVSLMVVFITLGIFLQMKYLRVNDYRSKLADKFESEYKIALAGKRIRSGRDPLRQLRSEIGRIKDVKSGILSAAGDDSLEAKLTFLLEALNNVDKSVDLTIEKITVTTRNISVIGNTSSRGYLKLFAAIDKHPKISRGQSSYESKDGRDHFRLTVSVK